MRGASEAAGQVTTAPEDVEPPGRKAVGVVGQPQPPASATTPVAATAIVTMFRLLLMRSWYPVGWPGASWFAVSTSRFTRSEHQDAIVRSRCTWSSGHGLHACGEPAFRV